MGITPFHGVESRQNCASWIKNTLCREGTSRPTYFFEILFWQMWGKKRYWATEKQTGRDGGIEGWPAQTHTMVFTNCKNRTQKLCSHFWITNITEIIHLQECSSEPQPAWWLWSTGWELRARWQRPRPRRSLPVGYRGGSHPLLSMKKKATQWEKSSFQYARTIPREKCLFF